MGTDDRRLDALRAEHSELENHYIDELVAGRLDRRTFLRRGAVLGMSASAMGAILAACGGANKTGGAATKSGGATSTSSGPVTKGGTLKLALQTPAAAINPLTIADAGGLCLIAQTGEFLTLDNNIKTHLEPMLATKWTHNGDGTVWTFKLRSGVKFHNGKPMTADDVVYTFQQQADPKNASNALSTFQGVLKPDGVRKVDSETVAFHLEAANGSFPYIISSDNYNAIIVPKGTDFANWGKTMIGTGPFKFKSYAANQGAQFVANPSYWGGAPHLDGSSFTFYGSQQPQILALQGGTVDTIVQFVPSGAQAILSNAGQYSIIKLKSSNHRELSMRCDQAPFTDPRVRQAIAYSLDRPAMVQALLQGYGEVGNDNPFAPMFPSTNTSVPQRTQNIAKAKQLLKEAGHSSFTTTLFTEQYEEVPQLATVIQQSASKIGVKINLKVETQSNYYGKATFGNSDWLDGTMSLVDYGSRGVPNVFLESPLTTGGPWNAAHFKNKTYDNLVKQYVAAVDLQTQKQLAGKIERLLLDQTPLIIPYFIDGLTASTPKVHGLNPTSIAQIFLGGAYIST
ncbi:MAG TPA: ABC transporter substrate-binding protein [Solirubrobacteraceae bacterium]|jgi:peptide/nickel transport system substrate-binding protein|nr:ABC transporter substrate-binding protein [Solirubrobacteraceae bacterium]